MPKLHELLAVEKDRNAVAEKMMGEATKVFEAGTHYHGHVKSWEYSDENRAIENRTEKKPVDETVPKKLEWLGQHLAKALDLRYQIDLTNAEASANLVLDGVIVAEKVPVSYLLMLETRLARLRSVYSVIPTHAPGVDWQPDTDLSKDGDIYKMAAPRIEFLTQKVVEHIVVVPPTEHHPAQVAAVNKDLRVGKTTTTAYTSTVTPAVKAEMLGRIDTLIAAAKRARQRANETKAPKSKIGAALVSYINTGNMPSGTVPASDEEATEV